MHSPIEQFEIKYFIPQILFSNASLFMVIALAIIVGGLLLATSKRSLVPGRAQAFAEGLHDFVLNMMNETTGKDGMRFFPLVFSLFTFVLTANLVGLIPYSFTVTSHLIVTFALAVLVIGTVIVYGFMHHGAHFLHLFVPSGVPGWLLPFLVLIEIISFISRPISLSLRLFANMMAGHIALKIFAGFVVMLGASGFFAILSPLPLVMAVALMALELLVACLQAYVFAILTCIYLNDALHIDH
ncbi:F0F1 ATP synthase subunit A [Microvirga sp. W0021]|uniref:ATP synthase subunit a n=1 Tax=Hohaiivirga grylli TaxID=3133970 RepID=A0ABV0BJC8_9HYPH